ncbi:hypothetical protein BH18THE2_BH18THE2_24900 [soil metagenome]
MQLNAIKSSSHIWTLLGLELATYGKVIRNSGRETLIESILGIF